MYLIYDTETTGLPGNYNAPLSDVDNWPRLVQLAWQLHDSKGKLIKQGNKIVVPEDFTIPFNAVKIHGIDTERANNEGFLLKDVLDEFLIDVESAHFVVGHNIGFDINIVGCELFRKSKATNILTDLPIIDTKDESTDFCAIPGGRGGKFKWPTLTELHQKLFGQGFGDAHDAAYDVDATAKCFFGLITNKIIAPVEGVLVSEILYQAPLLTGGNFKTSQEDTKESPKKILSEEKNAIESLREATFVHLHNHSQFSILQSTTEIGTLIETAKSFEMPAIALTDSGNMMAAFNFVKIALEKGIKPIVGCEFNLCNDRLEKTQQNNGNPVVLLAKNKNGYQNLIKLASYAYTEGQYYVPRIDKSLLLEFNTDLIALSGSVFGEIPHLFLNVGEKQAEDAFLWWKTNFGEDFYAELNRHQLPEEDAANKFLLKLCKKHDVKYVATNNTYYAKKEDARAHDILLCVKDGETVNKPKVYIGRKGREYRFGMPNNEFYLKNQAEMKQLFSDLPEAIINIQEIVDKVETYKLAREVLLPKFEIPTEFQDPKDEEDTTLKNGENNFLRHLTYKGAEKRYPEISNEIKERIDFELSVIRNTGYPGYFLIVQDFIAEARKMGVSVGPGRGSAAGSVVAYCTGITNIDPLKYNLLFERFLNPERVSMPDIDIDFDDEGRASVIQYVIEKYGANQVAQIITYGSMAAKSSIRDTARALELPLSESDIMAKLVPDISLSKIFKLSDKELAIKLKNSSDEILKAKELIEISKGTNLKAQTLNQARILEGSVRNTGTHACGVIITPDDITNFVPIALVKDSTMFCTQFDNNVVESAGLLKMDFLGLKTLTLIKDACVIVKEKHGVDLDPEEFPIDDPLTYELFQRGDTVGIFQYESAGMQKHMRHLKPTVFADLIAMNALYRPGPIAYIPNFIKRKHGEEDIVYDIPEMEEYLAETYGITVYQEQVMLLSQSLAGFTKGEADTLRKAMGKKIKEVLDKMKPKFIEQAMAKGHPEKALEKVWKDWEAFAEYAFNKSHSTCYAWVAYQTAYLKAHYPAEYMASVLSNNMNEISQVTFFMEECKRMGIKVLGPDVNESKSKFTVNKDGAIRFGLAAIKGAGKGAVEEIIIERLKSGEYVDFFEFAERLSSKSVNKKTYEVLAQSGGFDGFEGYHRRQYLDSTEGLSLIESALKYASKKQADTNSNQQSLFGSSEIYASTKPKAPDCEPFSDLEQLNLEKEVVGLFISGHPLDQFRLELEFFCTCGIANTKEFKNKDISIGGMVTAVKEGTTKNGKPYGVLTIQDFTGTIELFLMGEQLLNNKSYFQNGLYVFIKGKVELDYRKAKEIKENSSIIPTDEDFGFKAISFSLLSELREKNCKSIDISLDLEDLNEKLIHEIVTLFEDNPGKCGLNFTVKSTKNNLSLNMMSRKYRVSSENNFFKSLDEISELSYKISV